MKTVRYVDKKSAKKVIAGLAILTAHHEEGKDYIDVFVSLVAHCIVLLEPKVISSSDLQVKLEDEFGIKIPQSAITMILHRVEKRGYIVKSEGAYIPNMEALDRLNYESIRKDVIRQENAAVMKLVEYAKQKFGIELSREDAEEALLSYIGQNNVDLLNCSIGKKDFVLFETEKPDRKMNFVINSFFIHMSENDPDGFKYLDTIVKGLFISYSLVFPQLDQLKKRFKRTDVYLDTALILRRLGFEGARRSEPCKELINLLYQEGAGIKCFRSTRDEVYSVLYGCMLAMTNEEVVGAGPTYNHFLGVGYGPSEIEFELVMLDKRIENAGIRIVDKPRYIKKYQIDESELESALISGHKYWQEREKQRVHDVDCLSAIYRLREGNSFSYIEDSKAIFVTANSTLCRVSSQFFIENEKLEKGSVPIATTDYALTSLIWLKKPVEEPDLPQKLIIAQCYAAIEPSETLWRKYVETAKKLEDDKLITSDDYYLLRSSQLAHSELMHITMGDERIITDGTAEEILERIKEEMRKDDLLQLEKERKRHEEKEKQSLSKLEEERKLKEEEKRKLTYEHEQHRIKIERLEDNIEGKARRLAHIFSRITFFTIVVLISTGALFGLLNYLEGWLKYILSSVYVVSAIIVILLMIYGIGLRDCVSRYESFLQVKITNILKKLFLPLS